MAHLTGPIACKVCFLRKRDERQSDGGGRGLTEKNFAARRGRTKQTRNRCAAQKEHPDGPTLGPRDLPPKQTGCKKADVQPLVGGKNLASRACCLCSSESAQTGRLIPQEHFQDEDVQVQ